MYRPEELNDLSREKADRLESCRARTPFARIRPHLLRANGSLPSREGTDLKLIQLANLAHHFDQASAVLFDIRHELWLVEIRGRTTGLGEDRDSLRIVHDLANRTPQACDHPV